MPSFMPFGAIHCDWPLMTTSECRCAPRHCSRSPRAAAWLVRIEDGGLDLAAVRAVDVAEHDVAGIVLDRELEMAGVLGEHAAAGDGMGRRGGDLRLRRRLRRVVGLASEGRACRGAAGWAGGACCLLAAAGAAARVGQRSCTVPGGAGGGGNCARPATAARRWRRPASITAATDDSSSPPHSSVAAPTAATYTALRRRHGEPQGIPAHGGRNVVAGGNLLSRRGPHCVACPDCASENGGGHFMRSLSSPRPLCWHPAAAFAQTTPRKAPP